MMLDSNLKPYLLSIDENPDLQPVNDFDKPIKKNVIRDAFKILGLDVTRRNYYKKIHEKQTGVPNDSKQIMRFASSLNIFNPQINFKEKA